MVELAARTPLDGYRASFDGLALVEAPTRSIVSIAGRAERARDAFGVELPDIGHWTDTAFGGGGRLLGLQRDQWFLAFEPSDVPESDVRDALGDGPAVTDQSDAWAALQLEGPNAVAMLERTCRLDLHGEALAPGRVVRTAMDHLSVVIVRETDERFVLMSPRSSAGSFLHAMTMSALNVAT